MSVSNIFRQGGLQWWPDADAVNAPEQALLRADNLVPDQTGALAIRRGSSRIYSGLNESGDVNSLYTVELSDGNTYRVAGIGDKVYINGVDQGVTFDGTGDISIGDDSYQIFMSRGTTHKKFNGTEIMDWGVEKPQGIVTLGAVAAITMYAAEFKTGESPAVTAIEGSIALAADQAGTADNAQVVTPATATSRASITRLFTTDQDFFDISGAPGSETDLFDMYVKFEDPARVETVKVIFGCDNSSTLPFVTDRFEFTFNLRDAVEVSIKDPQSEGLGSYTSAVQAQLSSVSPLDISSVKTPLSVKTGINAIGTVGAPKSGVRPDPGVWGHLSVTRGQFKRIGSTKDRGWDTIRGFQIVIQNQAGYVKTTTFSDAIFIGGGDRSLTGTFKCVVRAAHVTDQYIELSPPSAESLEINLNHQTLQVTIPASMVNTAPDQVDEYWVYLFGGFLDTYYRFSTVSASPQSGMTIDELTNPDGSNFDDSDERMRLTSTGHTIPDGVSGSAQIIITIDKSELDALTENERLEPYQAGPVDNIVAIAGPWNGRMFILNGDGYVSPSSNRSPSGFNTLEVLDLTKYGDPLWMTKTASGIVVGCEKDIVFLAGSGDENPELTEIDLYPQPLNVGNPPVDKAFAIDGNAVIYRSADGLMTLTGTSLSAMPTAGTSLLWRGQIRHGVSPLNTATGRFRLAIDNLMLYMLAPEGTNTSGNVVYRFSFPAAQWSRLVFSQVDDFLSITKEPSGNLIAGDTDGNMWLLDSGEQDETADITLNWLTPIMDGGQPLAYKDAFDLQLHCNTAGDTGTVYLYKDGSADVTSEYEFSTLTPDVFRINASDFGRFLRVQLGIQGSFNTFSLQRFNLTYRTRTQHSMHLDTGYILPAEPGDVVWLQEVEVDMFSDEDVTMELYHDDILKYSVDIVATPDVRTTYVLPLPRGSKAKRPRLVFKTTDADSTGHAGFDMYSVRVRARSSGNQNSSPYVKVFPAGDAP